jgi:hypothetical protein
LKRGLILYVAAGKEDLTDWPDLGEYRRRLEVDRLCVATSEAEINYHWWRLITCGMQHISCMLADFDDATGAMNLHGSTLRLCG